MTALFEKILNISPSVVSNWKRVFQYYCSHFGTKIKTRGSVFFFFKLSTSFVTFLKMSCVHCAASMKVGYSSKANS